MKPTRRKALPRGRTPGGHLTIRHASPADARRVADLAALDEASVPPDPLLLAEVDGELWVVVSLSNSAHVADPFRPSGELAFDLLERARELRQDDKRRRRLNWSPKLKPASDAP